MKKTISINISGIIFYIEEDGYDKLNNYLQSIQQYFAGYEGNKEIVADIESRIAEIFFSKTNANKQVITLEDVEALISTMGNISDFDAIEGEEHVNSQNKNTSGPAQSTINDNPQPTKKLFRDEKRKTLGGVASGIAHYLKVDPLWIRLIFILCTSIYGSSVLAYIILWVAVPGTKGLEDDEQVKKFYRDPGKKVVGGVASGLTAYFGGDQNTLTIIRIVLIISFCFFGAGFYFYCILWIITPEAKTVTEKMQMHGQPVTLSNIEMNIKKNLNAENEKEESLGIKILLFPFRVISQVMTSMSPVVGSVFKVSVAFVGVVISIVSFALIFSLIVTIGVYFGLVDYSYVHLGHFPTSLLASTISLPFAIFLFFTILLPIVMLGLLGATLVSGRSLFNKRVSLGLVGIWFVCLIGLGLTGLGFASQFKKRGKYEEIVNFNVKGSMLYLQSVEEDDDIEGEITNFLNFSIDGYEGNTVKLEKIYSSQGLNKNDAIANSKMMSYNVKQQNDSSLVFDDKYILKSGSKFRGQHLSLRLYVPYDQPFTADDYFINLMNSRHQVFENRHQRNWELKWDDYENNKGIEAGEKYKFTKDEGLVCLSCKDGDNKKTSGHLRRTIDSFDQVQVSGAFEVRIKEGKDNSVEINAPKDIKDKITTDVNGNTLEIKYEDDFIHLFNFENNFKRPVIFITMPSLERLELNGATKGFVSNFNNKNDMHLELSGASEAEINANTNLMEVVLNGASSLKLFGSSGEMKVDASGASHLEAFEFKVGKIQADVNGASEAKVYATSEIEASASGAGHVKYRGNPSKINNDESGAGSVVKD